MGKHVHAVYSSVLIWLDSFPLRFGIHFRVMTVRLPEIPRLFLPLRGNGSGLRAVRALRAGRSQRILSRSSCCWRVSCRGILPVSL